MPGQLTQPRLPPRSNHAPTLHILTVSLVTPGRPRGHSVSLRTTNPNAPAVFGALHPSPSISSYMNISTRS
ncbi:hypothetical protein BD779DRAFT_1551598 [Infundibulicybe gibba]|nr:hypothetical protein BD779DRAFT_1576891 [Infundibulicybe gibba]KAF8879640.1 hypothetical protein BD779DRAFT_1551598 [Infundibulicybe gibba]